MRSVFRSFILTLQPDLRFQHLLDLLLLLLHHVRLHRILLVVVLQQSLQLKLLLDHRSWLLLAAACTARSRPAMTPPPRPRFPPSIAVTLYPPVLTNIPLLLILIVPLLISRMINSKHTAHDRGPTKIIHRQITAPLIFVLKPCETPTLARILVPSQFDPYRVAVLGKDRDNVALGQLEGKTADVDVGRVAVVGVP